MRHCLKGETTMRPLFFATLASLLIAFIALSEPASAADPVGTAVLVRGGVTASGAGGSRSLTQGGAVYLGDKVETGIFGHVDIEFSDHTRLAVGPNSSMMIDDYVVRSPGRLKSFGLKTARGAFRFLTGDSPKQAYNIKTPTATIGIRGTEFDWAVQRVAATAMALYGGATRICSLSSGACADLRQACDAALVYDGRVVKTTTAALTDQQIARAFPFLGNEGRVGKPMRVGSGRCNGGEGRPGHAKGERGRGDNGDSGGRGTDGQGGPGY